jgi:hypothetical protein
LSKDFSSLEDVAHHLGEVFPSEKIVRATIEKHDGDGLTLTIFFKIDPAEPKRLAGGGNKRSPERLIFEACCLLLAQEKLEMPGLQLDEPSAR